MDILIGGELSGMTVREYLTKNRGFSSRMIKKLKFSDGGILVNGSFVTVRYVLKDGDVLSLATEDRPEDVSPYTLPSEMEIGIIYEDEYVTAVNKPAGMPSHPSHGHRLDTVSNALAYIYRDKNYVFRPVNRLDRDTSGCMLTSNTRDASYKMYRAMTEGKIKKTYIAVADGVPEVESGVIDRPIGRCPTSIITRRVTSPDDPAGKEAVTEYCVLAEAEGRSLLLLRPLTGRTHQIRVHLASVGAPVTGDDLYGKRSELIKRQALHCAVTEFPHPADGRTVTVAAPLPDDMARLTEELFPEIDTDSVIEREVLGED